jgi:hypothetical protein
VAHLRSNTVVRIHRSILPPSLPVQLEAAALLVRGSTPQGRYHLQVTAAAIEGSNSEAVMFRMIPDIELLNEMLSSQTSEWIVITLRGIGEMIGDKSAVIGDNNVSWMNLSPLKKISLGLQGPGLTSQDRRMMRSYGKQWMMHRLNWRKNLLEITPQKFNIFISSDRLN